MTGAPKVSVAGDGLRLDGIWGARRTEHSRLSLGRKFLQFNEILTRLIWPRERNAACGRDLGRATGDLLVA